MSVLSKIIDGGGKSLVDGVANEGKSLVLDISSGSIRKSLDYIYRHNALLLSDVVYITGLGNASIPLPIVGFVYENPHALEMLKYEYSEYPYLNKTLITNSYTKQNTKFSLRSYRAITSNNGVATNIALNEALYYGIEYYCDRGGTFKMLTMWGAFSNLVLESLQIVQAGDNQLGGIGFEWQFRKIPFDTTNAERIYSNTIASRSNSTVPVS